MLALGIETSCDETSCAVVENGRRVLSSVVASSADIHAKYGGVVPEMASRRHIENILPVCDAALKEAGVSIKDISMISVTDRPGLAPALLVGVSAARALALWLGIPIVYVNHIYAHLYSVLLDRDEEPNLPCVGLVASGGHSSLFLVVSWNEGGIKEIGRTKDDAAGEAFDKVAKMLGLPYPGGRFLEELAREGKTLIPFGCYRGNDFDFSFSGLKTAVRYFLEKQDGAAIPDIAYSVQRAIVDALVEKTVAAARMHNAVSVVAGGGVVSNGYLRNRLQEAAGEGISVWLPEQRFCQDNAAMIAGLGYMMYQNGEFARI